MDLEQMAREFCERYVWHATADHKAEIPPQHEPQDEETCHRENCAWPYRVQALTALLQRVRDERDEEWEKAVLEVRDTHYSNDGQFGTCEEILRRMGRTGVEEKPKAKPKRKPCPTCKRYHYGGDFPCPEVAGGGDE